MFGFWRRLHGQHKIIYRARKHPEFLLWQYGRYRWQLALDPEAPVEHYELLRSLDIGENYGLFQRSFTGPRHAKQALRSVMKIEA
jgi:hypothetical protein